jgi:hypothetical protein
MSRSSSSVSSPGVCRPDWDEDERLLKELEVRSKLGLLDTLQDTRVAFQTFLGENEINGRMDMYIPHSFTIHLAHMFFQRIDPFNVMIKNYEVKQNAILEKHIARLRRKWTTSRKS